MIVSEKMWKEYEKDYEKEAVEVYEDIEAASKDIVKYFKEKRNKTVTEEWAKEAIIRNSNCDWKLITDGRVFRSYKF